MMKITALIKDNKFHYHYEVGASKQTGYIRLNCSSLTLFTEMIRHCQKVHDSDNNKRIDIIENEIKARAFVEKYPAKAERWVRQAKKQVGRPVLEDDTDDN